MTFEDKTLSISDLAETLATLKAQGKRVVLCHGNFDLLHIGHIRYFEQARQLGDVLVVTLTPDRFVDKGPDRPAFNEQLRLEGVASLGCVDFTALNEWPTAEDTLRTLLPDVYAKGAEFENIVDDPTGKMAGEAAVCKSLGVELAFTHDVVFSSSNLINRFISGLPEENRQYLNLFSSRYSIESVSELVDRMSQLKVLVVGDAILDEYQYCNCIGKSSKDPVLAMKYQAHDLFAGGVFATANHAAGFAGQVDIATVLGDVDRYEDFIRENLRENITPKFVTQPGAPTTLKRRFIDGYSTNKLLEVYVMDDSGLPEDRDEELNKWLREVLPQYDVVLASDFGHGAISARTIKTLCEHAPFLAVNTQANAGNRGFNTVTKYPRMDYACLAEHELRLEMRDTASRVRDLGFRLFPKLGCQSFMVTRGRLGCEIFYENGGFIKVPSFAASVVDRIGAGDALFGVTSLAAVVGADEEMIAFLGNVVGSMAVQIIGNERFIESDGLKKHFTALLK